MMPGTPIHFVANGVTIRKAVVACMYLGSGKRNTEYGMFVSFEQPGLSASDVSAIFNNR